MRFDHVPVFDGRYWLAISLASIVGCNLGDLISTPLHWNHWIGLAPLAALFAILLSGERRSAAATEAWYWAVVVVLRAAATNLADFATHSFVWPYPAIIVGLTVTQVILVLRVLPRLRLSADGSGRPAANPWYWASLLTAGVLGTVIGDGVADRLGLGTGLGTLLLGGGFVAILSLGSGSRWATKTSYWAAIVAIRAAGTTAGDWLAFPDGRQGGYSLNLGLPLSAAVTGALFIGVLWSRTASRDGAATRVNGPVKCTRASRRSAAKTAGWLLMGLAGLSVIFSTELPILFDKEGNNHQFLLLLMQDRLLFVPHAIGGVLAMVIGPVQFSTRLRRRHLELHRVLGRVYAYSVLVATVTAVAISWSRPLFLATLVQSGAWFVCTLFAIITARNGYLVLHRQWMIRSYAMTFTFISLRFLNFIPAYASLSDANFTLVNIIVSFLSVAIPTIAFDWHELTSKARRPAGPSTASQGGLPTGARPG